MRDDFFPVALASAMIVWPIYRFVKLEAPAIIKGRAIIRHWPWLAMGVFSVVAEYFNLLTGPPGTSAWILVLGFSLIIVICADTMIRVRIEAARRESPPPRNHGIMQKG